MGYTLNFAVVWRNFGLLLSGLGLSLVLALVSIALGVVIGLVTAFVLNGKGSVWRGAAVAYVAAIRNTPILILILFTYFALPQLGVRFDKIQSFVFTLSLYAGAYLAEVFRGALNGVPKGLREAAGFMVNYLYDLDEIEKNHEDFAHNHAIASSRHVRNLLRTKPQTTGTS